MVFNKCGSYNELTVARKHAEAGRLDDFRRLCEQVSNAPLAEHGLLLDTGVLLSSYGFVADARFCYERAEALAPADLRASINLANLARDAGEHRVARCLYAELLQRLPDNPIVRRNALTSQEYDPAVSDPERLAQALAWGNWAIIRAGGVRARPPMVRSGDSPLRLGYVSPDLCQHTVGLFVKDVLTAHNPDRVQVFVYSSGTIKDWVTKKIASVCSFRDVSRLNDEALAAQIFTDCIDILIDLSGHTAGSRLTAFAYRPAPVMVSWLGYFATTGLPYMDAVLLDRWHAPPGAESQFIEPIIQLLFGRLYYQPVPWAPIEVATPPSKSNGYITFGCFNNTAKFNETVFDVWSAVLRSTPNSRLVLKWRTFNDEIFQKKLTQAFVKRGVSAERIELRGSSFHVDLLGEYADIDIALDPFPFTGGMTSCEALWMGVPVVTWPQNRAVSRQTLALLSQIGLQELAAETAESYIQIAVELAHDFERLAELRAGLRKRMRASSMMDLTGFTSNLEDALIRLYFRIKAGE